jgi:hypothetical protein
MRSRREQPRGFSMSTATKSPLIAVLDVARWRKHLKPDSVVLADTTGTESIKKAKWHLRDLRNRPLIPGQTYKREMRNPPPKKPDFSTSC